MPYFPPTPRWTPLAARVLFAALMGAALAACGNDDPAPPAPTGPVAQNPPPAPGAADPSRACSTKSASMRCAP